MGRVEALVCPGSAESRFLAFSCHEDNAISFEVYQGQPAQLAATTLAVVPDLEVLEDRVGLLHDRVIGRAKPPEWRMWS